MEASFDINTRDNGEVEVVVRPAAGRPFRLVGFASRGSAEDWVRTRVAREERRLPAALEDDLPPKH